MKLKIWGWKDEAIKDIEVFFKLIEVDYGIIELIEVDKEGTPIPSGKILTISTGGVRLTEGYNGNLPRDRMDNHVYNIPC